MIKGKRGHAGVGYTLKSPNKKSMHSYVYVWDRRDYCKTKQETRGWRSLGNSKKMDTWVMLLDHLLDVYGEVDPVKFEKEARFPYEELEEKRIEQLNQLNDGLIEIYRNNNIGNYTLPETIASANRQLNQLRQELS